MKYFLFLLICIPLTGHAQDEKGIYFEKGLTWEQVKTKAMTENKYIFVDCYATWCGPCKFMDKTVYTNDTLGEYVNSRFISVKVQMDTGKNDDNNVKILYPAARRFERQFRIIGLPTFLFFSPTGDLLHKEMGAKTVQEFTSVANDAFDSSKQLYTLIKKINSKTLPYEIMPDLIRKLKTYREDSLSLEVEHIYIHNYLDELAYGELFKKQNLELCNRYIEAVNTTDRIFRIFYENPGRIDSVMEKKDYTKDRIEFVLKKEMIKPIVVKAEKLGNMPDWNAIQKRIQKNYDKVDALEIVLNSEIDWNRSKKNWGKYCQLMMVKWKLYGPDFKKFGPLGLNDIAWTVYAHSVDSSQLAVALDWTNIALEMVDTSSIFSTASILDTKANIIYKMGLKEQGLSIEMGVVKIVDIKINSAVSEAEQKYYSGLKNLFQKTAEKMKTGTPIVLKNLITYVSVIALLICALFSFIVKRIKFI